MSNVETLEPHPTQCEANGRQTPAGAESSQREETARGDSTPRVQALRDGYQLDHARAGSMESQSQKSDNSDRLREDLRLPRTYSPIVPARTRSALSFRRYSMKSTDGGCNSSKQHRSQASVGSDYAAGQRSSRKGSLTLSIETYETTSTLSPLQASQQGKRSNGEEPFETLAEDFDLAAQIEDGDKLHSPETLSELLFSGEHLKTIFADPSLLLKFTSFLSANRPNSIPILIYYMDATKAMKAISYVNAIAEALEPVPGHDFTSLPTKTTVNSELEDKAEKAFDILVQEDLPAYIAHVYVQIVKSNMVRRVTGPMIPPSQESLEGLAEAFCVTDASRPDNPIVFASEAFHQVTHYGMNYIIGRNCRFLQGPKTNPSSLRRIRESIEAGNEHCELILNYRRDGSPFINLLMHAPLRDSFGKIRYFMGAQVDVTSAVNDTTDFESLRRVITQQQCQCSSPGASATTEDEKKKDKFQELSEMLDMQELQTARKWGARMLQEQPEDEDDSIRTKWRRPGVLWKDPSSERMEGSEPTGRGNGKLSGFYQNYLLVRPYPSLRILFASASLRIPGMLQSPIMNKIGGSPRARDDLTQALAEGRAVTAQVRWVSRADDEGRSRWIHFTPLFGSNGRIGVWVAILVDGDQKDTRRMKQAPPVKAHVGRASPVPPIQDPHANEEEPWPPEPIPGHTPKMSWSGPNRAQELGKASLNLIQETQETLVSNHTVDTPVLEVDDDYESLEERLRKKRQRNAARTLDQSGLPLRRTYKSLSPYAFMDDDR